MTTVGYGDITPETPLGRFLSAIVMLLGYTIIAVPTGIVSASMIQEHRRRNNCKKHQVIISNENGSGLISAKSSGLPQKYSGFSSVFSSHC